ncbi:hypothetical protein BGC31_04790 [Komagataeibacter xylinus]|nr:hypothetical protein BGC31_04790 [Komagataeibacter xylinus]RFP06796.1 hypothetical protein BFX83_16425 [Komagataeibacter xylinus]
MALPGFPCHHACRPHDAGQSGLSRNAARNGQAAIFTFTCHGRPIPMTYKRDRPMSSQPAVSPILHVP